METTNPEMPISGADTGQRNRLTRQQRVALLAEVSKGTAPARKSSAEQVLLEWRPLIIEYYRRGYDLTQIRGFLASPKISIHVSLRALERLIKPTPAPKPVATTKS